MSKEIHNAIRDHEKTHGCKVASAEIDANGNIGEITCVPWPNTDNYIVSIRDCRATLCREHVEEFATIFKVVDVPASLEKQMEAVLCCNIEDQGGAINCSGLYPLLHRWAQKLRKLGAIPA